MHEHDHHAQGGHFADCARLPGCTCETRRYSYVLFISLGILAIEIIGWWISNSLALLGDSAHVAADAVAISVALIISIRVRKQTLAKARETRILGLAVQIMLLAVVGGWICIEGIIRFSDPPVVLSVPLMVAALTGAGANLWQVSILAGGFRNFTAHGTRAHLLADFAVSIGVIASAIIIGATEWYLIDPLISLAIALFVAYQVSRLFALANREAKRKHSHHDH